MADLSELMAAHTAALAAYDALGDAEWDARGVELDKIVGTTREAIFNHRPATIEEVGTKAVFMATTRTFFEWDDFDPIKLVQALTPIMEAQA
ncbi:hypothetical protein [Mesorhizobium sp. A623]